MLYSHKSFSILLEKVSSLVTNKVRKLTSRCINGALKEQLKVI